MGKKILLTLLLILLLSSVAMAQPETCRQCHEAVVTQTTGSRDRLISLKKLAVVATSKPVKN